MYVYQCMQDMMEQRREVEEMRQRYSVWVSAKRSKGTSNRLSADGHVGRAGDISHNA